MERLHSVLDGDAKKAVSSIGTNSIFYAAALKTLKREFGHPIVVANLKLKAILINPRYMVVIELLYGTIINSLNVPQLGLHPWTINQQYVLLKA